MKEDLQVYNNVLELIGDTPLVKLNRITQDIKGEFFAKVEAIYRFNISKKTNKNADIQ